jgi:N-acetylmuramoyl-L-alanine amidase/Putative peptidoglycan binding domain
VGEWTDIAQWVGPTPNRVAGGMGNIIGVVLHIQQGNEAGSISWCENPASQVSAHFFAPKTGGLQQLVDTNDVAWAEAAGNAQWLSIENEGYSGEDLTPQQVQACAQVLAKAHQIYGVALASTDDPSVGGLGWHGMGGDAWGGHPDCPGTPITAQRAAIIDAAQTILGNPTPAPPPGTGGLTAPTWPGRTFIYPDPAEPSDPTAFIAGTDVRTWQARMAARGWSIGPGGQYGDVDGQYGPECKDLCEAFQKDSNANGWPLLVDGEVGPLTWAASWERPVTP